MLDDSDRRELLVLVQSFIGAGPSWDTIAELVGPVHIASLPGGLTPARAADWIIQVALARSEAGLFVAILGKVNAGGMSPALAALAATLARDPGAWRIGADPADLFHPVDKAFLDREDVRPTLLEMSQGTGPALVTIEAPEGLGKTTIAAYLDVLCQRAGVVERLPLDIRPSPVGGLLDSVAADLRSALRLRLPLRVTQAEPERQGVVLARELAQGLAREAALAPTRVCAIVTLAEPPAVEPGVIAFLDELMGQVTASESVARRLAIAVVTQDTLASGLTNLPAPDRRFVLGDVPGPSVLAWLKAAAPGKPEDLYAVAAETVLTQVSGQVQARRLEWLRRYCEQTHRDLLAQP